jgi:toxin-antitoxin system PIN domain toxin
MLIDANVLLYAVHRQSPHHDAARAWLTDQLNGPRRVGLPWQTLTSFLRISTHSRAFERPLEPSAAWSQVREWLAAEAAWIPHPGAGYAAIVERLLERNPRGNLIPDVMLAALAIEHGLTLASADTDFAGFDGLRWLNPLA